MLYRSRWLLTWGKGNEKQKKTLGKKNAYVGITIDVKLGHNANDAVLISFREVGRETEMRF